MPYKQGKIPKLDIELEKDLSEQDVKEQIKYLKKIGFPNLAKLFKRVYSQK